MTDVMPSFSAFLRAALGDRVDPSAQSFADMMAEDGVMEFPFARPEMTTRLEGRDAIATYMAALGKWLMVESASRLVTHPTADPEVVILEFEGAGRVVSTGEPYAQKYISVIRTRDGRIVHYKDYWNPIEGLKARWGAAAVANFVANGPPKV